MKLTELEIVDVNQKIFDGFNDFMLSSDIKVFGKLLARTRLMESVKDVPGDIVECGVFKGTGLLTFLKLKRYLCPNTGKKVLGFDFFNSSELVSGLDGIDKEAMSTLFEKRGFTHDESYAEALNDLIRECGFAPHEFELVEGDVCQTSHDFIKDRPGFRISLLYLDLDLEVPTKAALEAFWDRVSKGGIVVFDEYAFHKWSESNGVDSFFADKEVKIESMNYICPTAYVVKQ